MIILKKLITIENYIKIKETLFFFVFIIISKLRCGFVSKIVNISYLFAAHVHDGKEHKMLLTDEPNCRFDLLH